MANTKSAEKAARQAEKHRARNVALRSRMRTAVRKVTTAIATGDKAAAQNTYKEAVPVIDTPEHVKAAEIATRERKADFTTVMLEGR